MGEIKLTFKKSDLDKIHRFQHEVPYLTEDHRLKRQVGMLLSAQAKRNIEEQSPDGITPYKALNIDYEKYKGFSQALIGRKKNNPTKRGVTNNRGVQSGILRKSIDWVMGAKDILYLTTISYGKYHQFGGEKLPARPIFSIRETNKKDIMYFIVKAYKRLVNKSN